MSQSNHIPTQLTPKITVVGVGGAGGNAVNNMVREKLSGVDFLVTNTDAQALSNSICENRLQLGNTITRGLGAGSKAEIGQAAAEEQIDEILAALGNSHMVFITAGMGGGTGTGAAPVIARVAREQGMLTVGVVTKPFQFEGHHRMKIAEAGILELQKYVDTLIIIPNQNLFRIANEQTTFATAFKMADDVLMEGVRGVTDLMVMPGLINLDFADIRAIMTEMGKAMMGTGEATGEGRSIQAAEAAIANPLLDDISMQGAQGVLINITGGPDMTLFEVDEAANRIRDEVDPSANIIFGSTFDDNLEGIMRVSVVATGIESSQIESTAAPTKSAQDNMDLFGNPMENTASAMPEVAAPTEQDVMIETPHQFIPPEPVQPQQPPVMNNAFSEDFNTAPAQPQPHYEAPAAKPSFLKRFFSGKKQTVAPQMQEQQATFSNPYPAQSIQIEPPQQQQPVQETQPFAPSHFQQPAPEMQQMQQQPQQPMAAPTPQAQPEQIANDNLAIPAFLRRQQKN